MPVRVNIVGGGEHEPVECDDGANTKAVKEDLLGGFGKGILKRNGKLVLSDTLAPGDYEYHLTTQQGAQLGAISGVMDPTVLTKAFQIALEPVSTALASLKSKVDLNSLFEANLRPSVACKSEMSSAFLNFMSTLGFTVTTELSQLAKDLPESTSLSVFTGKSFAFSWSGKNEVDSYAPLADHLTENGLTVQVVGNGQNISHGNLISVTIAERRKNLMVQNGELVASRGEFVVAMFNLVGNTDLVRLKKRANKNFVSRSEVMYAFEVKTVSAMESVSDLNCCLREALLQLVGLNAYNTDTSPSVILTNLNGKHYVLYIDWPHEQLDADEEVKYTLQILHAKTLNVAIDFAETLATRRCGTRDFARGCSPHLTPRKLSDVEEEDELVTETGKMHLDVVVDDEPVLTVDAATEKTESYTYGTNKHK